MPRRASPRALVAAATTIAALACASGRSAPTECFAFQVSSSSSPSSYHRAHRRLLPSRGTFPMESGTTTDTNSETATALFLSRGIRHSPLEDSPWETDPSYYDRLREAAKDPESFEAFVMSQQQQQQQGQDQRQNSRRGAAMASSQEENKPKTKKGRYQRIEEWDEDQRSKQDGSGMAWEEKVQFDGMRQGNRLRQNDILVHHLKSF